MELLAQALPDQVLGSGPFSGLMQTVAQISNGASQPLAKFVGLKAGQTKSDDGYQTFQSLGY